VNRALWLLLGLQLRGWLRYLTRSLGTVKGALLAAVGLVVFLLWVGSIFLARPTPSYTREQIQQYGPLALLLYCLLNVLSTSGERAIYFSPGEVNFLFPAPFGRRELLAYKLALSFLFSLPTALFMTFVFQVYATSFIAAFIGLLLVYQFMMLFVTALNLAASALGARLFTFSRRAAAAAAVVLVALVVWQAGLAPGEGGVGEWVKKAVHTDVWRVASQPLSYFFDTFLSETLWPDLAWNALLALLVDMILLGVVFGLDADYLEASVAASARIYARLQRARRVGPAAAARGGTVRFSLPMAPWWGGAGPIFWRQLTTATRGAGRLLLATAVFGLAMTAVWTGMRDESETTAFPVLVGFGGLMMTFLTTLAPFDFRGDVDQMALLKTLPTPAWRLAMGQLLAPVLIFTLIQWSALAAVQWLSGRAEPLLLAAAAFAPVYNFVLFGVENLLFLLFPTRVMVTTPGDFQAIGRNVVSQFAKALGLGGAGIVAAAAGVVMYIATGSNLLAAGAAAWLAAVLFAATLVPLMGWAFRVYDVGRDAPP
jgi:Putative ABC exporter